MPTDQLILYYLIVHRTCMMYDVCIGDRRYDYMYDYDVCYMLHVAAGIVETRTNDFIQNAQVKAIE